MKCYQFTNDDSEEYLVFVSDEDDAKPDEYAMPGYELHATAEDVDFGHLNPGEGDRYVLTR